MILAAFEIASELETYGQSRKHTISLATSKFLAFNRKFLER